MSQMIEITCPDCKRTRSMRLSNYKRGGETGICLSCANTRMGEGTDGHIHEGYKFVKAPHHHRATNEGFVKRAILTMEIKLSRLLEPHEHIHHINGIRDDDRPSNLMVVTNSENAHLHMKAKPNIKNKHVMALTQK